MICASSRGSGEGLELFFRKVMKILLVQLRSCVFHNTVEKNKFTSKSRDARRRNSCRTR